MTALAYRVPVARRQLAARRGRTIAGVAGIASALLLVLALQAIFAGLETRMTAYIDQTGADIVVAQQGVASMHMTQSALPPSTVAAVEGVPGVTSATGIVYRSAFAESAAGSGVVAVVGGGPVPGLVLGRRPRAGEIVIDRALAGRLEVKLGDRVGVLGAKLRVVGEVEGTAAINGSYTFVTRATLAGLGASNPSYVLVRAKRGEDSAALARRIESRLPVTASSRRAFAASERQLVGDMSTDIVRGMIVVGFVIGVAVAGLVAYSATLAQLRDYGVLRAVGMGARRAALVGLGQVAAMVFAGFTVAFALVMLLAASLPALSPTLALTVRARDVAAAAVVAAAVNVVAGSIPLVRVLRLEPASVFRRSR